MRRPTHTEKAAAREAARADRDTITRRYRGGEPVSRLARAYGVSETWLRLRLEEWGVPRRPAYEAHLHLRPSSRVFKGRVVTRRTKAEVEAAQNQLAASRREVAARYREGESAAALAREFGVSPRWLAARLDEWGVPRRDRSAAAVVRGPGVPPL